MHATYSDQTPTMVDQEAIENPTSERIKQTISVPFLWEEKPGTPKLDWKQRVNPIIQLPVKLIEEKPGTPLPGPFSHQEPKITFPSSPPLHLHHHNTKNPFCDSDFDNDLDHEHQLSESDLTIIHSSPNNLKIHHKNNPFCDSSSDDDEEYLQAPSSPAWETESIASSCATSLAGSSFLECMFPLITPKATSFEAVGCSNKLRILPTNSCTQIVSYAAGESKPLTLGELIMMSRRRSYLKKAIESQEYNHSTELMVRNGVGC